MNERLTIDKIILCHMCSNLIRGEIFKKRVDSPFNKNTHGKDCLLCAFCNAHTKEYNEAQDREIDLYPYVPRRR